MECGYRYVVIPYNLVTVYSDSLNDFVKAVKKRNLGLTAKQKLLGQFILAAIFCYFITEIMVIPTTLWIPVVDAHIQLGFAYYILAFLIIVGATNAVNLTDGLDGLASGTSAVAAIAFSVIGLMIYSTESSVAAESVAFFGAIVTAVCLGFLVFNINPAKVFMGDTGSLALGGAFAGMAILTKTRVATRSYWRHFCNGSLVCYYSSYFL